MRRPGPSHRADLETAVADVSAKLETTRCVVCRRAQAEKVATVEVYSPEPGALVMPVCEWCASWAEHHADTAAHEPAALFAPELPPLILRAPNQRQTNGHQSIKGVRS